MFAFGKLSRPNIACNLSLEKLERRQFLSATAHFPASFTAAQSAPVARFEGYNPVVGGKVWAMGGFDKNFETVAGIDIFDPKANSWTHRSSARIKAAETHAGWAVDGKVVYFAGGYVGKLEDGRAQPISKNVWRFDTRTSKWIKLPPLPTGRGAGTLVKLGRELHFFGGCGVDRVTNFGDHWVFSLGKTSSRKDDGKQWVRKASLPSPRDHLASAAIGNRIYAIGGEFGHDVLHKQSGLFQSYNPKTDKWTRLPNLPVPRSHIESGTFVMNNRIVVAGGQVSDYQPTNVVNQYDPKAQKWTTLTPIPAARQGGLVHPISGKMVITLGGTQTSEPQDQTWIGDMS